MNWFQEWRRRETARGTQIDAAWQVAGWLGRETITCYVVKRNGLTILVRESPDLVEAYICAGGVSNKIAASEADLESATRAGGQKA